MTLEGRVEWQYQRAAAARVMSRLPGVTGVVNLLHVVPPAPPRDVRTAVEAAFERSAQLRRASMYVEANRCSAASASGSR